MLIVDSRETANVSEISQFPPVVGGRIPSLDGLRAIAIFLVITTHMAGGDYNLPGLGAGRFPLRFVLGEMGVRIFFVISGFLITTLLLLEHQKRGRISLGRFYFRRALRILPASYTYLFVMMILAAAGILVISRESFVASFLYFRNYVGMDWYTGHLWSLSVEEQFYLIWPATLVLLGRQKALIAALLTLPIADLMRFIRPGRGFETNMDALACGCILAIVWGSLGRSPRWQRFLQSPWFWTVPVAVLASNKLRLIGGPWLAVGVGIANVLIAVSLERFVRYSRVDAGRYLNLPAVVFIGTLSYSLYLWQEPWVLMMGGGGPLQTFPVNIVLASACALLSYTLIERPFLRLKDRWRLAPSRAD